MGYTMGAALLAVLLSLISTSIGLLSASWPKSSALRLQQLQMSSLQGQTYVPVVLQSKKRTKTTILVKAGATHVLEEIASWSGSDDQEDAERRAIEQWTAQGLAFPLDPEGAQAMVEVESKRIKEKQDRTQRFGSPMKYAARMYHRSSEKEDGGGGVEKFIPLSEKRSILEEIRASTSADFAEEGSGHDSMEHLVSQGKLFTNVSKLFVDEQMLSRIDTIATRMHNEFPLDSPEWKRWTTKTTLYNATSLTQVMAMYYQENSIGDVGGPNANYIPRRGYPGTLAPGEKFTDNYPLEELPKKILHPWPSMQQIQFHVRWPPNHPMLPPPLLWFGLNNMYTDNFTDWQLNLPSDEIVGGAAMDPKDAIRIARFGRLGSSYAPEEQIPHGGMIFPGGHQIPFYNPDHGPTIPLDVADAPIPAHLLPITERWLDPLHGLTLPAPKTTVVDASEEEDDLLEEEVRRAAAERLMSLAPEVQAPPLTEWQDSKLRVEEELTELLINRKHALAELEEWDGETGSPGGDVVDRSEREPLSPEFMAAALSVPSAERDLAKQMTETMFGKPLGRRALINYVIHSIRDMKEEISRAERDLATRKKTGRKRSRKRSSGDDEEEAIPELVQESSAPADAEMS